MYFPMALPTSFQYFSRFGQCSFLDIDEDELDTSSLHTRTVKPAARENLINRHRWTASTFDTNIDATTLLSDIGHLAPSLIKEFIPKDHVENTFPFRLINDIDFHGEEEGYIALSYCRKQLTLNAPRRVVTPVGDLPFGWQKEVEQFPLPTSAALFEAVIKERNKGEGLWFDQVCLEQEDESETTGIVGAIDVIYKNARAVVVALDDIAVTPDEEQFLRYYVEQYSYSQLPSGQEPNARLTPPLMEQFSPLKTFLERIIGSDWFERAWCSHEMKMGRSHIFLVPSIRHYEDEVQTITRFTGDFFIHLLVLASELATFTPPVTAKIRSLLAFFQELDMLNRHGQNALRRPDTPHDQPPTMQSFTSLVTDTFRLKAGGDPRLPEYVRRLDANRDKTAIALNASGLPLALAPPGPFSRPNIEDECLRSLLLVGIAARDPVALCTTGTPLQLHDGSVSWLCRPTPLDTAAARSPPLHFSSQAGQIVQASDGRAEYAQLDLIFLDLPHRTQPSPSFPTHVVRARMIIDLCVQYHIPGSGLWNFSVAPNHPRTPALRNIFIQTLACVLSCGSQWLLEVLNGLQDVNQPRLLPYDIEMLLNPHLILQNYILLPEGQTALSSLVHFLSTLITSGIPWPSGASERTHGPLIISAPSSSSTYDYSGAPLQSGSGKAIIFAPFEHSKTLLIAVPDVVKGTEYAPLARGWILTSMNPFTGSPKPTVSWTLQSKGVVFGDAGFSGRLAGCGRGEVRNHRVYGSLRRS
ncbi:uncharacterized protein ALTATR162_LOCUS5148 [Alternaria atra]|uniref:Heterokaryon incompatibility domain-containing protein n=1 Tax=Alternaria atra TaxID=119953 RepID=A0A8J2MZP4_9PLEO|nr:uncharacterized protein ALTATR162_LOCUS5148 [Alternaria atra]CAG5158573.1 unnamed protein product [Alternaria atra]